MFKVETNPPAGNVICQQVEHYQCMAECRVLDNRALDKPMQNYVLWFELRPDYDETDGYIKHACERILHSLGYSYCGLIDFQIEKYCYDSAKVFLHTRRAVEY